MAPQSNNPKNAPEAQSNQGLIKTLETQLEKDNSALQQQALRIAHAMQTTLDVYYLIKRFADELKKLIYFNSFSYVNEESEHQYQEGMEQEHSMRYQLKVDEDELGTVVLTRSFPFEANEVIAIENAIAQLVYPLRNSIKYHEAVLHSLTDPLTQLGNRYAYNTTVQRELDFAIRHGSSLTLLVCDIDKFKVINDQYGHSAGDRVLKELGTILTTVCRNSDVVFRYGGEEFVIVLSHTCSEGAQTLAKRILQNLSHHKFKWDNENLEVTLSVGITSFKEHDTCSSIFDRADQALYQAKHEGGNQIKVL